MNPTDALVPPAIDVCRPSGLASSSPAGGSLLWRIFRMVALPAAVVFVFVLVDGADRRPADPNEPLLLRNESLATNVAPQELRLATFNIHGCRGRDGTRDLGAVADTIQEYDFVALQEAHGGLYAGRPDQCAQLGERLQFASLFAPTERRWWRDNIGNGLLTRVPLSGWQRIPLPGTQDGRFRNLLLARLPLGETTVRVLIGHLDNQRDHDAHLRSAIDLFLSLESPAVLMGDLNSHRLDPQLKALFSRPEVTAVVGERFSDGRRMRAVDWIIARGLVCRSQQTIDLGASDHPAVAAVLALPEREGDTGRTTEPRRQSPLMRTASRID